MRWTHAYKDGDVSEPPPDSGEVLEAATEYLANSPYSLIRRVSCEYDKGVLFLQGRVSCYYRKQLAQKAVSRIDAIRQVVNRIEVVARFGQQS